MILDDPHHPAERTAAARALLVGPWRAAEHDPALFTLIRRHSEVLDRWVHPAARLPADCPG